MKPTAGSQSIEPHYIVFTDPFTKRLFSSTENTRQFLVAPAGSALLCPGFRADGLHGFRVGIHMARIAGDTAVGVIEQSCQDGSQEVTYATSYLVVKQRASWQIVRTLGGTIAR